MFIFYHLFARALFLLAFLGHICFKTALELLYILVSAEAGLPPNTKVKIELQKASDEFLLMKQPGDTENYKLKITNICLYIPIAQLSAAVFNELNTYMTRKIDPQPVGIHYRRTEVRPITFPKNKQEYFSDGLFTDSEMPCRICLCFVETSAKIGKIRVCNKFIKEMRQ